MPFGSDTRLVAGEGGVERHGVWVLPHLEGALQAVRPTLHLLQHLLHLAQVRVHHRLQEGGQFNREILGLIN